jgi:hypothetical protein
MAHDAGRVAFEQMIRDIEFVRSLCGVCAEFVRAGDDEVGFRDLGRGESLLVDAVPNRIKQEISRVLRSSLAARLASSFSAWPEANPS